MGGTFFEKIGHMAGFTEKTAAQIAKQLLGLLNYYHNEFKYTLNLSPASIYFASSGAEDVTVKVDNPHALHAISTCMLKATGGAGLDEIVISRINPR